jgi:hypothetical protein
MEAIMRSGTARLIIAIAAATGVAIVSAGAAGNPAPPTLTFEPTPVNELDVITVDEQSARAEADARLSDRELLRRILLDGSRDRLR